MTGGDGKGGSDGSEGRRHGLRPCPAPVPADPLSLAPPPEVRLVREYKGPTLEGVLQMSERDLDRLPARIGRVLAALRGGRLRSAAGELDGVLASMHTGPGRRRRLWRALGRAGLIAAVGFAITLWILWAVAPGALL